jgi:taurine dioxygenase
LTPPFGVALDYDLRRPLDAGDQDELRALFADRHLLLFENQSLSYEDQERVVGHLGPVLPGGPEWVSNVRENGLVPEGVLLFHSDFIFTAEPSLGLSLYAVDMPPDGSPTVFADAVRAAAALPPALRRRIEGHEALNIFDLDEKRGDVRLREAVLGPETPFTPRYAHPVLMHHPRTGQELLSVNEMQTDRIMGMEAAESEEALRELWSVLYAPGNTYTHRWRVGDLLIWDNIAVQHGRPAPPRDIPRTMRRVTMAKHSVFDLVPGFAEARASRAAGQVSPAVRE